MTATRNPNPPTALEIAAARQLIGDGTARQVRASAGLSRRDIAEEVGVSANTVRRWEAGEVRPSGVTAVRYLQLLRALAESPALTTERGGER